MEKPYGEFLIPDDHVVWIGRIAETWALFEFHVDQGIWALSRAQQQLVACVTAQLMSVHPRLKAFTALCELSGVSKSTVDELKKFAGDISSLAEKRNRCVHDPRVRHPSGVVSRFEATAKPKVKFGFFPEPVMDLQTTHREIYDALKQFISLRKKAIAEHNALPPEALPQLYELVPGPEPSNPSSGE